LMVFWGLFGSSRIRYLLFLFFGEGIFFVLILE
jgi:hypothetical protein